MASGVGVADVKHGIEQPIAAREPVRAALRLAFECDRANGQTFLASSYQEPPLRVVRAFPAGDGVALVHLHNVSGGLLGGDQLALTVHAGAGTNVQIATSGATRIYRPRAESLSTRQRNEVVVGENALLEYLPDTVIPFAGARFSQRSAIWLAAGAGLFWWEILAPGREARGEIFEYASVEFRTDLVAAGELVAVERMRLEPGRRSLSSLTRMGEYRTWATFYICRIGVERAAWLEIERELRGIVTAWNNGGETLWGVSTLSAHGLTVRCIAQNGRRVLPGLQEIWRVAKQRLYGRAALVPRKVN
jgi:urease accessory protein